LRKILRLLYDLPLKGGFRLLKPVAYLAAVLIQNAFHSPFAIEPPAPRIPDDVLAVPLVNQATNYTCGPAALSAVLKYWQVFDGDESELSKDLHTTPEYGTDPGNMEIVAKNRFHLETGYFRYRLDGDKPIGTVINIADLRQALKQGITAIIDLQAWKEPKTHIHMEGTTWSDEWDEGHYEILVGMDSTYAYFVDPSAQADAYVYVPLTELEERWHDVDNGGAEHVHHPTIFIRGTHHLSNKPNVSTLMRLE
jgi:predicted double-glycine peptidase